MQYLLACKRILKLWNVKMCAQANKHHAEKQSPGFAFTLCIISKYNNTTNAAMGDDKNRQIASSVHYWTYFLKGHISFTMHCWQDKTYINNIQSLHQIDLYQFCTWNLLMTRVFAQTQYEIHALNGLKDVIKVDCTMGSRCEK